MQCFHTFTDWDSGSIPKWREGVVQARLRGRGMVTMTTGLSPSVGGGAWFGGRRGNECYQWEGDYWKAATDVAEEWEREREKRRRKHWLKEMKKCHLKYQVKLSWIFFKITYISLFVTRHGQVDKDVALRAASDFFLFLKKCSHTAI